MQYSLSKLAYGLFKRYKRRNSMRATNRKFFSIVLMIVLIFNMSIASFANSTDFNSVTISDASINV